MPPWVKRFAVADVVVVDETDRDDAVAKVSDVSVVELLPFASSAVYVVVVVFP